MDQALRREAAEAERVRQRQAARDEQERKRREEAERRAHESERRRERARTDAVIASAEERLISEIERLRPPERERLRILYVTATPEGGLRVDKEMRRVNNGVRAATERDLVEIHHLPAATASDLLDGMSGFKPHVVHFSGHADRGDYFSIRTATRTTTATTSAPRCSPAPIGSVDRAPVPSC